MFSGQRTSQTNTNENVDPTDQIFPHQNIDQDTTNHTQENLSDENNTVNFERNDDDHLSIHELEN